MKISMIHHPAQAESIMQMMLPRLAYQAALGFLMLIFSVIVALPADAAQTLVREPSSYNLIWGKGDACEITLRALNQPRSTPRVNIRSLYYMGRVVQNSEIYLGSSISLQWLKPPAEVTRRRRAPVRSGTLGCRPFVDKPSKKNAFLCRLVGSISSVAHEILLIYPTGGPVRGLKGFQTFKLPESVSKPKIPLNYSLKKLLMVGDEMMLAIKPLNVRDPKTDVYLLSKFEEKFPSLECVYSLKRPVKILEEGRERK